MANVLYENGFPIYALVNGQMVEVQEVRHGRWENDGHTIACSNCHMINIRGIAWNYCPNCGAKMDEVKE